MNQEQLYRDSTLTLTKLAAQTPFSARQISTAINQSLGTNFYEYINKWRIEEAKVLLRSEAGQTKRISEIMYDVGFNSKSSFNTAFKNYTNQTPSTFRKSG